MQDYLKHYNLRITALAPIHVGSGAKLGKKEYIHRQGMVIVPDTVKMFGDLQKLSRADAYREFMLSEKYRSTDLGYWLSKIGINDKYINSWKLYSMDPGDAFTRRTNGGGATPKDILTFMKDAYGMPYIPGSTIKGMLRTAIICYRVSRNLGAYKNEIKALDDSAYNSANQAYINRNTCLKKETADLETAVLHTLVRDDKRKSSAVNSIMSGFIVSDSAPLPMSQLTLAQKIDYTLKNHEAPLPILREALKPGSHIDFELTIDARICNITIEEVFAALNYFGQVSYDRFYSRFGRGSSDKNIVWLGGGTGFLSKTILYPVYGDDAVGITSDIFYATIGSKIYNMHNHDIDFENGVAPHVCKCTRYGGKLYDMGMGKIELKKL